MKTLLLLLLLLLLTLSLEAKRLHYEKVYQKNFWNKMHG